MIYSVSDINERFQLLHKCMMKAVQRRRHRKVANANRKAYRQRAKPEIPRDKNPNYWQSAWGQLLKRLASIEGGPCITSRIGKRFTVTVNCSLSDETPYWPALRVIIVEQLDSAKFHGEISCKHR